MVHSDRQFTPFERLLRRMYELSLRTLPRHLHRRWAADMRATFGERLREATDRGGVPATAFVGAREVGSIGVAAMQSRLFGQATGRVHRAHDAQDGSDVWRTDPVPALFLQRDDRRPLKLATVGALACHFALFLVVIPGAGTDPITTPVREILEIRRLPPPERRETLPPDAPRRSPSQPMPLRYAEVLPPTPVFVEGPVDYDFGEADQPVAADFAAGLPVAPPTPPRLRVRAGADVEPPRLLERIQPDYPELAMRARRECTVVLESIIGKGGQVLDIKILRGCGLGFDEAALDAVYQWRYTPTLINGRPVEVIANVTVHFELQR